MLSPGGTAISGPLTIEHPLSTLNAIGLAMRASFKFLRQDSNQLHYFVSGIMDVFCAAGRDPQAEQSNHLAEGPNPHVSQDEMGQVWGTEYIKAGKEFATDLQVRHVSHLKSTLGVKRTTTNWAVLREC
eukprot:1156651-Pelagomonas_calceolata.AAC.1